MLLGDLAEYLEAQGIGTRATNLFYGLLPEDPDALVTMYEYPGLPNEPNLGQATVNLEFPRVQVITRGVKDDYDTPRQKAQDVVTALTRIANAAIVSGGVQYKAVMALNAPAFYRRDANFRVLFTTNFQVTKGYTT